MLRVSLSFQIPKRKNLYPAASLFANGNHNLKLDHLSLRNALTIYRARSNEKHRLLLSLLDAARNI